MKTSEIKLGEWAGLFQGATDQIITVYLTAEIHQVRTRSGSDVVAERFHYHHLTCYTDHDQRARCLYTEQQDHLGGKKWREIVELVWKVEKKKTTSFLYMPGVLQSQRLNVSELLNLYYVSCS